MSLLMCVNANVSVAGKQRLNVFSAERIIEKIQERMRHGFPSVGIKPLVPLKIHNFTQQFEWSVFK